MTMNEDEVSPEQFWDARYSQTDRVWSGEPNTVLVREAAKLTPGRALDLGSGEGADAIWLARQGWRVTAVDISQVALDRAEKHAVAAGVERLIEWQRCDLAVSFPMGTFDLVSAQFLQSEIDLPREAILRAAAAAVAPGGVLLIVGHAGLPSWMNPDPDLHLPIPAEVLAALHLPAEQWELLLSEEYEQSLMAPDGRPATRTNNTLEVRHLVTR
jgi:SAM-dependent methyltransferase